jgi:competence protein ComEC
VARRPDAFADDCRDATLIVSKFNVPPACAAAAIDRRMLSTTGALALRRVKGEWVVAPVRSPTADRPWFGRTAAPDPAALARLNRPSNALAVTQPLIAQPSDDPKEAPDEEKANEDE